MMNENMKNMEINEEAMVNVAGGKGESALGPNDYYVFVETGWLALRSKPEYGPNNEIEKMYKDQIVTIVGQEYFNQGENKPYVWVRSKATGREGWTSKYNLQKGIY